LAANAAWLWGGTFSRFQAPAGDAFRKV
jgi:hypothetical protein